MKPLKYNNEISIENRVLYNKTELEGEKQIFRGLI